MRDAIIVAPERSRVIGRYRMIDCLPYFLRADPDWAHEHLVRPLSEDSPETIAYWRAVAHAVARPGRRELLGVIGTPMADRAVDPRVDRETRHVLLQVLVFECLQSLFEGRQSPIPLAGMQQMTRSLDDEAKAVAAEAIRRFVRDVSASKEGRPPHAAPDKVFRSAAKPFLEQVWPQERSLATPGVSKAFADLPSTAGEAFAEAVGVIERFLVPFDCWSVHDYGFLNEKGEPKFSRIDSHDKAAALLRLLDSTLGRSETAILPYDLSDALDRIRTVAPDLATSQAFRRLAASSRRI